MKHRRKYFKKWYTLRAKKRKAIEMLKKKALEEQNNPDFHPVNYGIKVLQKTSFLMGNPSA